MGSGIWYCLSPDLAGSRPLFHWFLGGAGGCNNKEKEEKKRKRKGGRREEGREERRKKRKRTQHQLAAPLRSVLLFYALICLGQSRACKIIFFHVVY